MDARVYFCRFTQISLLRLLTTSAVMAPDELIRIEAWEAYDHWREDSRVDFLEEPPNVESAFRRLTRHRHPNPKNWADAYLAAFATVSGVQLVTFDRGLQGTVEDVIILRS